VGVRFFHELSASARFAHTHSSPGEQTLIMSKQILFFPLFIGLIASVGIAAEEKSKEQPTATAAEPSGDTTIATVNGEKTSLDMFRYFYTERLRQTGGANRPEAQNQAFNEFINLVVTAQAGEKEGLSKEKRFQLASEMQHLQLLSSFAIRNALQNFTPTEEDFQKAYKEHYGKVEGVEYKARHILVKTKEEAQKLIGKLKKGADFSELAKANSIGPTAKDGGQLPWFSAGQMVQPFTDATAALKPGEYSTTPVHTQYGWHVILLEKTRAAKPPALDDVKGELAIALQQEALATYITQLREKAKIELNPEIIKVTEEDKAAPSKTPNKNK